MAYKFVTEASGEILFYERIASVDTLLSSIQNGQYEISNTINGLRIYCVQSNREVVQGKQFSDFIDVDNQPFSDIETMIKYYASVFVNAPKPLGAISTEVYSWRNLPDAIEINGVQVITLDFAQAFIFHNVDLEGRVIVCNNPNLTIIGFSSETSSIKSTGKPVQDTLLNEVPMITFLQTCACRWIRFEDSDYPVLKDAPSGAFDWFGVNTLNCDKGFVIKNALFDVYTGCGVLDGGSWTLDGPINAFVLRDSIVRGNIEENANLIDITANAVVTGRIRFEGSPFLTILASQTAIFVDVAATFPAITAAANYPFQLENCRFGMNGTPLVGRVAGDGFTLIKQCSPLLDSKPNGQAYFQNNVLSTVINNIGFLVPINANFILNPDTQEFILTPEGNLQYKGRTPRSIKIIAQGSVTTGNNRQIPLELYHTPDGGSETAILGSYSVSTSNGNGRAENLVSFGLINIAYDSIISYKTGNLTNTGNIIVPNFSCIID